MRSRAKLCAALLVVVVTMAILPAATASASLAKSSVCKAYKSEVTKESKATNALTKDLESGNWATIKTALLAPSKGKRAPKSSSPPT